MDNHFIRQASGVFSGLDTPFTLFDLNGKLLLGSVTRTLQPPLDIAYHQPIIVEGAVYYKTDAGNGYLLMTKDSPAAIDSLKMAAAMLHVLYQAQESMHDMNKGYQQLLLGDVTASEQEALIEEYKILREGSRCVLLLSALSPALRPVESLLKDILPLDGQDMLISMNRHTAAMIKTLADNSSAEELTEYAAAMQETALSEEGLSLAIGIGETVSHVGELSKSYRQAKQAMEIGSVLKPKESIFVYRSLLLERFLADIPQEMAARYHGLLFNRKTARLFTDEMLDTINMFLDKDLNISDTARQMYIHRNTLVYRLEKVQKQTGLDLRHFHDAMTFKLLFELKKCTSLQENSSSHSERK